MVVGGPGGVGDVVAWNWSRCVGFWVVGGR